MFLNSFEREKLELYKNILIKKKYFNRINGHKALKKPQHAIVACVREKLPICKFKQIVNFVKFLNVYLYIITLFINSRPLR